MQTCRPALRLVLTRRCFHSSIRRNQPAPNTSPDVYDIVCVGGGPAGLSIVNGLKANPSTSLLRIALIDSLSLSTTVTTQNALTASNYSNRCSSLTPASIRLLNSIGAWKYVDHSRVQPYNAMRVWDGVSSARINFDWPDAANSNSNITSSDTIATMTENSNIISALVSRASELGGIDIFDSTKVESIVLGDDTPNWDMRSWPLITLSSGQTLAARLLIGADGANSPVRTFAGIESRGWDYDRHGVVATLNLDQESTAGAGTALQTAYQRFLPSGPIALLPLPDGKASLVWTTYPARAAYLKQLPPAEFVSMVNAAFRLMPVDIDYMHTLSSSSSSSDAQSSGTYSHTDELTWRTQHTPIDPSLTPPLVASVQEGSTASFPLKLRHASRYTGERVALIGDAAHTIHPLAGQGLNLGLADVESLLGVIEQAVQTGGDIGGLIELEQYDADRYAKNHLVMGICDKLHKVYSWGSGPVVWGRTLGLGLVDGVGDALGVKGWIMRRAAGS